MKIKNNIITLFATLGLFASCNDDDLTPKYTVGETVNELRLYAGVGEGSGADEFTRAITAEDHHTMHKNFTSGTAMTLRVDGTWVEEAPANTKNLQMVTEATTGATTGADGKHNEVTFANGKKLFWDDFGTADPHNMEDGGGRKKGLTIYGVAVNGETTAPTVGTPSLTASEDGWRKLSWELDQDQTSGWAAKDLLTSNNIQPEKDDVTYATDGTLKFDDLYPTLQPNASNLLEFTHAMTKITVKLTAGEGFPGYATSANDAKFQTAPTVTLKGFYYTGSVNVVDKVSTATTTETASISALRDNGTAWISGGQHTTQFTALVFPGNTFTATIANDADYTPTSSDYILELNADGNIYKVTAAQLVKAIAGTSTIGSVNGTLEQGKNYILNIKVNKTKIDVTATIKDWDDVTAEEVAPKINIVETYGHTGAAFEHDFDFFRSTTKESGYSNDAWVEHTESSGAHKYTFHDQLYWPNHQTHYFFRGVYPRVQTDNEDSEQAGWIPVGKVSTSTSSASTIAVSNVAYEEGKYPSDLALGWPKTDDDADFDETCKVAEHNSTSGICATEGQIRMNFRYMMSQVEVELKTVDSPDDAKVNIGANTVVELVNVYNNGAVKLTDGTVTGSGDKGNYTLYAVAGTGNECKRHSAIVPQTLTFTEAGASSNVRFKITVTNDDAVLYTDSDPEVIAGTKNVGDVKTPATTDIYYADINPILKSDKLGKVAPNGKWESGVHYKYTLTLSKTAIDVTATLTDWETVTANDEFVWF